MMCLPFLQERDNMQKSEFLKALSDMWKDFDSRVLRYKVCSMLFGYEIYVFSLLLVNFMSGLSPSIHNLYTRASMYKSGYSCSVYYFVLCPITSIANTVSQSFMDFEFILHVLNSCYAVFPNMCLNVITSWLWILLNFELCFFHYCRECNLDKYNSYRSFHHFVQSLGMWWYSQWFYQWF